MGLGDEVGVGLSGREEPRIILNVWFEKLADGRTISPLARLRRGGVWEGEKLRVRYLPSQI